ncbi:DNA adenine methylase [Methanobrevibacter sp.]|uniref:DNA adenine methylase n=1 Tax=Methanobrevibacter sp. TaxID=66852 RepID=UPI00386CF6F4
MSKNNTNKNAKPFLKWAGGKKQVKNCIGDILSKKIKGKRIDNYFEPFLGGGAVFFHLLEEKYKFNNVYLGDINKELILTWKVVQGKPYDLISILEDFSEKYKKKSPECQKKFYYDTRDDFNDSLDGFNYDKLSDEQILRASQMIFLNKTCFNGLYRVNLSGAFNVPMGKYKNPLICDDKNILKVHEALNGVKIYCQDYSKFLDLIDRNSFVYLDPPYLPIKKNSFTNYDSSGFGVKEQIELSKFCESIDKKGARFILSNSDPKNYDSNCNFFKDHYGILDLKVCNHKKIMVRRSINSKGNKRGPINELLIYNF